jgi:hypothetical protein
MRLEKSPFEVTVSTLVAGNEDDRHTVTVTKRTQEPGKKPSMTKLCQTGYHPARDQRTEQTVVVTSERQSSTVDTTGTSVSNQKFSENCKYILVYVPLARL